VQNLKNQQDKARAASVLFLITDLEVGITRAQIAANAKRGSAKQRRNVAEARKAYEAVRHFRNQTELTPDEAAGIDEKLAELEAAIGLSRGGRSLNCI
jgi:hypothetical protein